ncbi:MAG: DNA polymerase III subunit gamma/tau, partial [Desulfatirhabdiaceae bacterium]
EITAGIPADVFEIDGASNNSVDQIRELRDNVRYMPSHSRYKIYIIDEVHMLSLAAFNALLKTLEEPPPHVKFMFATTEPNKVPITILSRCQRHDLKRIDLDSICHQLNSICGLEKIEIPQKCLSLIAREAGGSMRDALSLLDQVISFSDGRVIYEDLMQLLGVVDRKQLFDFSALILTGHAIDTIEQIQLIYESGQDIKRFYTDLLEHFRNLLVIKLGRHIDTTVSLPAEEKLIVQDQVQSISPAFINQIFDILFQQEASIRFSANPRLALEMIMFKLAEIQPVITIDRLIESIEKLRNDLKFHESSQSLMEHRTDYRAEQAGPPSIETESGMVDMNPSKPLPARMESSDPIDGMDSLRNELLSRVSSSQPSLAGMLTRSVLSRSDEGIIVIQPEGSRFSTEKIRKNQNLIQQTISDILNQNIQLIIQEPVDTVAVKKNNSEGQLKQDALNHPRVAEVIEIFGGSVIDIQIKMEEVT